MLGVVDTGQLHQDAVRSFALNRRLLGPGLVDAPANDLDRLIDRLAPSCVGGNRAEPHRPRSVSGNLCNKVRINFAQCLTGIIDTVGLTDGKRDRIALDVEAGVADVGIAQRVADIVNQRVETLTLRSGDVDLEQEIRAAPQIEPQRHLLMRQETRYLRKQLRAEQVRQ